MYIECTDKYSNECNNDYTNECTNECTNKCTNEILMDVQWMQYWIF